MVDLGDLKAIVAVIVLVSSTAIGVDTRYATQSDLDTVEMAFSEQFLDLRLSKLKEERNNLYKLVDAGKATERDKMRLEEVTDEINKIKKRLGYTKG